MLDESLPNQDGVTLGADAGYDTSDFVAACRETVAGFRKTRFRGRARTQLAAHFVAAAYNLLRMSKLRPT